MNVIDFPLCLSSFFGKFFQPAFVASIEAISAFSNPYGNDVHFPSIVCLGRGVFILFQKGTSAYWGWWCDGMEPKNSQMCRNPR